MRLLNKSYLVFGVWEFDEGNTFFLALGDVSEGFIREENAKISVVDLELDLSSFHNHGDNVTSFYFLRFSFLSLLERFVISVPILEVHIPLFKHCNFSCLIIWIGDLLDPKWNGLTWNLLKFNWESSSILHDLSVEETFCIVLNRRYDLPVWLQS